MNRYECAFEDRITQTVLAGQWPHAADEDLTAHAASCELCGEVAMVAAVLRSDHEQARREVQVPVAGQVWWRSAVRARLESAQAATRPMTWLHGITAAITVGVMLAAIGMAWPSIAVGVEWTRTLVVPLVTSGEVVGTVAGMLRASATLALMAAACLVIAPLAVYFALSND